MVDVISYWFSKRVKSIHRQKGFVRISLLVLVVLPFSMDNNYVYLYRRVYLCVLTFLTETKWVCLLNLC